jgi:hypothetical protein
MKIAAGALSTTNLSSTSTNLADDANVDTTTTKASLDSTMRTNTERTFSDLASYSETSSASEKPASSITKKLKDTTAQPETIIKNLAG